jgi:hypothetical protein
VRIKPTRLGLPAVIDISKRFTYIWAHDVGSSRYLIGLIRSQTVTITTFTAKDRYCPASTGS